MIEIRAAEMKDAAAMASLSLQLGYPCSEEEMALRLALLVNARRDTALVATLGGDVLGWIQVSRQLRVESGEFAEITGLVVHQRARGGGVGRELVEAARAWAQTQELPRLVVRMNERRTDTHGFYLHLGFKERKRQVVWEWSGPSEDDASLHT